MGLERGVKLGWKVDQAGLRRQMGRSEKVIDQSSRRMSGSMDTLSRSVKGVAAGFVGFQALSGIASKFFAVNRETERLHAQLKTVTGSSEAASRQFQRISDLAADTPFQIGTWAQSFVKLQAQGLEPTDRLLGAIGNTAAAMGKDVDQYVEAILDAVQGEGERLKEFGIKMSKQGDDLAFRFKGQTTVIANNADAIKSHLIGISETNFAGAMSDQMDTLNGILSNTEDNIEQIFRIIGGDGGVNTAMKEILENFRDFTGELSGNKRALAAWSNFGVQSIVVVGQTFTSLAGILINFGNLLGDVAMTPALIAQSVEEAQKKGVAFTDLSKAAVQGNVEEMDRIIKGMKSAPNPFSTVANNMKIDLNEIETHFVNMQETAKKTGQTLAVALDVPDPIKSDISEVNENLKVVHESTDQIKNTTEAWVEIEVPDWSRLLEEQEESKQIMAFLIPLAKQYPAWLEQAIVHTERLGEEQSVVNAHIEGAISRLGRMSDKGGEVVGLGANAKGSWGGARVEFEHIDKTLGNIIARSDSLSSFGRNFLSFGLDFAAGLVPGGDIVRGGITAATGYKHGSAGTIGSGPAIPMARDGMLIPDIGNRTQIIGVHRNEAVLNEGATAALGAEFIKRLNQTRGEAAQGGDVYVTINHYGSSTDDRAMVRKVAAAVSTARSRRVA